MKDLDKFFTNGKLVLYPSKRSKQLVVLNEISKNFTKENYAEKEINFILKSILQDSDYASIRRELIDLKYLKRNRDGSVYTVNFDKINNGH